MIRHHSHSQETDARQNSDATKSAFKLASGFFFSNFIILMILLYWNACGIGNKKTISHLKHLTREHKFDILAISEPKINGRKANEVCSKLGYSGICRQDAQGFKGGLWFLWKMEFVDVNVVIENQ